MSIFLYAEYATQLIDTDGDGVAIVLDLFSGIVAVEKSDTKILLLDCRCPHHEGGCSKVQLDLSA